MRSDRPTGADVRSDDGPRLRELEDALRALERDRDHCYAEWKHAEAQLRGIRSSLVWRLTRSSRALRKVFGISNLVSLPESVVTAIETVPDEPHPGRHPHHSLTTEARVSVRQDAAELEAQLKVAEYDRNGYRGEWRHAKNQLDALRSSGLWRCWWLLGVEPSWFRLKLPPERSRFDGPQRSGGAVMRALAAPVFGAARLAGAAWVWCWFGFVRLATSLAGRPTLQLDPAFADTTKTTFHGRPRVLIVSPYHIVPANHGSAVRLLNLIRVLSTRFELHLLLFSLQGENPEERAALESMGCRVDFVRWAPRVDPSLWSTRPRTAEVFRSAGAAAKLLDIVHGRDIDLVQLEHAELGQYAKVVPHGVPVVLSEIDIAFRTQQRRRRQHFHLRFEQSGVFAASRTEVCRTLRHEAQVCRRADQVHTMSASDARYLAPYLFDRAANIRVVPNGVDTTALSPTEPQPEREGVLFVGNFGHLPNLDALEWLLTDVWPLLRAVRPDAQLTVVGANITDAVLRFRDLPGVTIEGEVPDTRPYYHRHLVMVAPIRAGSGTRLKILEAFAAGTAVVSTALGAEGIDARHGTHLEIADSAVGFARAIERLLSDSRRCLRLAEAASELVREQYDWRIVANRLEGNWVELLGTTRGRGAPKWNRVLADRGSGAECHGSAPPDVSIVIPTFKGGSVLHATLEAIRKQDTHRRIEVVCVDSGSSPDDIEYMCDLGARVISIDRRTFNHGLTRDFGAAQTSAPILVFINQDAVPAGPDWLDALVSPLDSSTSTAAAVQGGIEEFVDEDQRFFWDSCGGRFYFTSESKSWMAEHSDIGFSTVNCAMRREVWQRYPFGWAEILEDKKWQREVSDAGYVILHCPQARVFHSHDYGLVTLLRRCFSEGYGWRSLGRQYVVRDLFRDVFRRDMYREFLRGLRGGRVRSVAEAAFPVARPIALWMGNRFGRRVLH